MNHENVLKNSDFDFLYLTYTKMGRQSNKIPAKSIKPKYSGQGNKQFIETLKERVESYFVLTGSSRKGGKMITIKTVILLGLYVGSYLLLLSNRYSGFGLLLIALLFGAINVLIVFNISHDAGHNALFKSKKINRILAYTFNLVGVNSYLWNITHNQIHHTYPNIGDYDFEIHQQDPLIRVSVTVPLKWYHRYQHLYAPLLYMTYSFFLVFIKDFQDIGILPKKDSILLENRQHSKKQYLIFFFSKLLYVVITILIPILVLNITWVQFLFGFIAVHVFMGLLLSVVLIPVHMVDEATFDKVTDQGTIERDWYTQMLGTTVDYARRNRWVNFFVGGLNTHLVHHLFSGICHIHYVKISEIVKETTREYGMEYFDMSWREAIISHFRLLRKMGKGLDRVYVSGIS